MVHEYDLQTLLIDDEAKQWHTKNIRSPHGFLWDWDDEEYPVKESRNFLKFLLAYDADARAEYLKKRRQNDAADAPDENFDEKFLKEHLAESRKQGVKIYAKKVAALYFCFDKETLDWYRNTWLNDCEEWSYIPERDDACLSKILATSSYRVKTPEIVEKIFRLWVLPFLGAATFLRAKKYGEYNPETFFGDVFQRLLGRVGSRKFATNSIDYWIQKRPCSTLRDWIQLETLRELDRISKQLQRARLASIFLTGELEYFPAKPTRIDEYLTRIDPQDWFDIFYAEARPDATLCAAYWSTDATFKEIASFYRIGAKENIEYKSLNKRYERALLRFKKICERSLNIDEIPEERWRKVVAIFLKSDEQSSDETTNEENETSARFKETANVERLKRVRFQKTPTKEDEALLIGVLEARRCDDTGCFALLYKQRMQGGGSGFDSNVTIPVRRRWSDTTGRRKTAQDEQEPTRAAVNQNSPLACGSPVLVSRAAMVRQYWRNKYPENDSIIFYFESATEAPGAETFWRAEARCPLGAAPDAEIAVVLSGYDTLKSGAVEIALGEKKAICVHGVAVFKLSDFRKEIEHNALRVTMVLRYVDGSKGRRWHVKRECVGRLLYRKPIVRDDE